MFATHNLTFKLIVDMNSTGGESAMFAKFNAFSFLLLAIVFATVSLLPTAAQAARVEPIQNIDNAAVPAGLDMTAVRNAIIDGCSVRSWVAKEIEDGTLQCTVQVRSHTAVVDISYSTDDYSITYAHSVNLKYEDGKIHRNYNSWVQNLNGDIQNALLKATR